MRLIAGSGRSGTTWVQDALADANGLKPVFEPLHPHVSDMGDRYAHRALAPGDEAPELREFLEEVCAGRKHRLWTRYRRQVRWLFPPPAEFSTLQDARRVYRQWGKFLRDLPKLAAASRGGQPLVKCIRANLMLGWLSRTCAWRVVLIVRHPGAVVESELRASWNSSVVLDRFRSDEKLRQLTGGRYEALLRRRLSHVESLASRWVIENDWVVEQAAQNCVTVVFYERLRNSPEEEWPRILRALGLQRMPPRATLVRPSQQSSPRDSPVVPKGHGEWRWQRELSRQQIGEIQGILDFAGVRLYSMADPQPREESGVMRAAKAAEST